MEKLMKPAEYAQEMGISRQAVYAKIKRGILIAKNVEGKLYIVVDTLSKETAHKIAPENIIEVKIPPTTKISLPTAKTDIKDYKSLLQAKNETISVLKSTVKDLKKSNKQISTTLRGEIDLLKDAFHEMRMLYVHQLEHKKTQEASIDVTLEEEAVETGEERWIGVKKFFKRQHIGIEKEEKVIKRLKKAYRLGDDRIRKVEGKLKLNVNKIYTDMLA